MTIRARRLLALCGLLGLIVVLTGWLLLFQPFHGSASKATVVLVIPKGSTVDSIGKRLEDAGVISNAGLFALRVRLGGEAGKLNAGTYVFNKDASYSDAIGVLTGNAVATGKAVTIPEGLSRTEISPVVAAKGIKGSYLAASKGSSLLNPRDYGAPAGSTLEGFLFPSTYQLQIPPTSTELVKAQVSAFKQQFSTVNLAYARSKNLTAYDVLTIAAMIERETAMASERPLVAAVIWNRLRQHIPLGIDATTRFQYSNWNQPLLQSQLASQSPWNTRNRQGLPPGPIGNPGIASIRAAANPAKSPFLYYVVKPWTCGQHTFSSTQSGFDQAVSAYNAARNGNGGRAPTKCP